MDQQQAPIQDQQQFVKPFVPQPGRRRIYMGKPENKRDPQAAQGGIKGNPPGKPGPSKKVLPRMLNKPSNLPDKSSNIQMTTEDLSRNSVFAIGLNTRENNLATKFDPSAPTLIDVSRSVYQQLQVDDTHINRILLPEYLDYYSVAMLWCRFIALKRQLGDPVSNEEERLHDIFSSTSFSIPEPILNQLKMFGQVQALSREHLRPRFPTLPTTRIQGQGGYYGMINIDNHNLYEEIPCLGVLSEAVRAAISDLPPGPYQSSLALPANAVVPNSNLLGFQNLMSRRPEAKNLAFFNGITADAFPEDIPGTGFNLNFLLAISNYIAQTKTFRLSVVEFPILAKAGSLVQLTCQKSIGAANEIEKRGDVFGFGTFRDQDPLFGVGIVYCPHLYKQSATVATANQWCCIDTVPQGWIDNRNARRDSLPVRFKEEVFSSTSQYAYHFRQIVVEAMATTKR